jgi:hypothetical protein
MKKLITIFVLTMQRYSKKPTRENLFNESALLFSEINYFTFIYWLMILMSSSIVTSC